MAQNYINSGRVIHAAATAPTTPTSGDPLVVGTIPGVALTDEGDGGNASGECSIATEGVFDLEVEAVDNSGNSAVAIGDKIYYEAGETIVLNKDNVSGVLFGKALEAITSGESDTIKVLLVQA
jgi:predicted RecA/RadA family phage recombinase